MHVHPNLENSVLPPADPTWGEWSFSLPGTQGEMQRRGGIAGSSS